MPAVNAQKPAVAEAVCCPAPLRGWLDFASHLARKRFLSGDLTKINDESPDKDKMLHALWQQSDISADDFAKEVALFFELPRLDLPQLLAAQSLTDRFSIKFLRENAAFPCLYSQIPGNLLVLGDPTDFKTIRAAQLVLGDPIAIAISSFEDIATALSRRNGEEIVVEFEQKVEPLDRRDDIESLRDLASGAPVVRALNDLLEKAVELRATDIHVEPFRGGMALRLRIDGLLRPLPPPPDLLPQALVSRIKILVSLNIAERRLPQDGAAHLRVGQNDIDIRVATMPTQFGEAAVIRLLPRDRGVLDIAKLGFAKSDQSKVERLLRLPHGMIVVTGPTGSGKTTTLATMLNLLNDSTRKILTIEDPVEYEIRGINQSQVKPEIGLTFASALRAFVRHDPDVIMVGEIRDKETSHIAVHAALTGHLVLTTLHTETAAAAVPRLIDLGVEPFLLQSTLRAVIAQRLVRVLCDRCKTEYQLTPDLIEQDPRHAMLGFQPGERLFLPNGCERCAETGYRGRTALFEVLEVTNHVRDLIGSQIHAAKIADAARPSGMTTMFEDGIAKCRAGTTSMLEVLRVTTMG
jgi:general secretion pathway protein E